MKRCQYSELALRILQPRGGQRRGVFLGPVGKSYFYDATPRVKVLWDGNKAASQFHRDFIEVLEDEQ